LVGTILPLVFAIHFSSHTSWFGGFFLEILINVTVPLTHFLYCYWSYQIDYVADETNVTFALAAQKYPIVVDNGTFQVEKLPCSTEKYHFSAEKTWKSEQSSGDATLETKKEDDIVKTILAEVIQHHEPCQCGMANERRIRDVWRFLSIGFFLGLVPLLVVPKLLMSECEGGDRCVTRRYVTKTSVVTGGKASQTMDFQSSSQTAIENILKNQNPGLMNVRVLRNNGAVLNSDSYHCVETWKDLASMNEATISVSNVMAGRNVEDIDMVTEIQATTCQGRESGIMRMKTDLSCSSLWKVLESGNYCGWIPGCKYMKGSDGLLSLYMKDGSIVNAISETISRYSSHVAVLSQTELSGFEGRIVLHESSVTGFCEVNYVFHLLLGDGSSKSNRFYESFIERFIPDLHERSRE
jgi:hypothetical protein